MKIISIFAIVMILAVMFTGCGEKEVAVETSGFITNHIIYEDVITENVIYEDVIH